ncbi:hypothetical protein ACSBR2_023452 [Camellia fascicularis]
MEGLRDLVLEEITIRKVRRMGGEKEKDKWYLIVKQPQHETTTKCNAFMYISFKLGINVDVANDTSISLKASHDLISVLARGKEFVGFTGDDQKSYLRTKRQQNL